VIAELDDRDGARLIGPLPTQDASIIIENLESDDAADLLGSIKEEQAEAILEQLPSRDRDELTELLTYHEESAGGIMATEPISAPVDATVGEVIELLRSLAEEMEDVYNVYLVDKTGRLEGKASLKELILAQPGQKAAEVMDREFPRVNVGMDREEVAGIFARYNLASAPVVDDNGQFLGRITHDDILDVMTEEVHEDIAYLTGQSEFDPGERSLYRNLRLRLPWLLLGLLGGLAAATLIAHFEPQLARLTPLIFFLPLVAAMGGNAGIQTSSLMVRGLATGDIGDYGLTARLARELVTALLTGSICGGATFGITYFWRSDLVLAVVVSTSLLAVIVLAAIIGALIPLMLKRFGLDPALATGPFITTTNDIFGLFIYLGIATLVLSKL